MTRYYAYTRVSTQKQGATGVSLQEQHAAIAVYAERNRLQIVEWFEEQLTAAKKGRPLFNQMLKGLRRGDALGVIIHKIDRGARNLKDWADLGDLIDAGVAVHFANESLDMLSRGGRLSADIQAVVAADFIRNLREETKKGLYGRLKQGLYPFRAPIGYVDTGRGKVKTIDPVRGPLVRAAFDLYATGRFTLETLRHELARRGLHGVDRRPISMNGLSGILNNPFYTGLIRIRARSESYSGKHAALIPVELWRQVQTRLQSRFPVRSLKHDFTLRGLFRCALCQRFLIGELQKSRVYYRCHTRGCPTRSFREDILEQAIFSTWPNFAANDQWKQRLAQHLDYVFAQDVDNSVDQAAKIRMQLAAVKQRQTRLIDAFLDGSIDKDSFDTRKSTLLEEERLIEQCSRQQEPDSNETKQFIVNTLELASVAQQSYRLATPAGKREIVISLSSNRTASGNEAYVEPYFPLSVIATRPLVPNGDPSQDTGRTDMRQIAADLVAWGKDILARNPDTHKDASTA